MNEHVTTILDYSASGYDNRADFFQAHAEGWAKIAAPGNWWRSEE